MPSLCWASLGDMLLFRIMRRFHLYPLFLVVLSFSGFLLPLAAERLWFLENGVLENLQLVHLALACVLTSIVGFRLWKNGSPHTPGIFVIALGLLWATHRETDGFWEVTEKSAGFALIRGLIFAAGVSLACVKIKSCLATLRTFISTAPIRNFAMGSAGYISAQIIPVLIFPGSRLMKRVCEESLELVFGSYVLIGAAGLFSLAITPVSSASSDLPENEIDSGFLHPQPVSHHHSNPDA